MFREEMDGGVLYQWLTALLANVPLLTYGLQAGWMSPMAKVLQSADSPAGPISDTALSWIASTLPIGATVGAPVFSYLADRCGRKTSIILLSIPQALCWILKATWTTTTGLIVARAMCGIAAGGCFALVPIYVKEISEDKIRGTLGSLTMFVQNIGLVVMYAMGSALDYYTILWIVIPLPVLHVLLSLKSVESPSYLVKNNKPEEAAATIAWLRGINVNSKTTQMEVTYLKQQEEHNQAMPNISIKSIIKNVAWRRGLIVTNIMITVQAAGGNFVIVTFASSILTMSGTTLDPDLQSISIPVVMLIASVLFLLVAERCGRKILMLSSMSCNALSMVILGIMFLLRHLGVGYPNWLPIAVIISAIFTYGFALLPIPYIVMSEMFSFQVRAKMMGFSVTLAWFLCFIQLVTFTPMSQALGTYSAFFTYALIGIAGTVYCFSTLVETKGKTVEQIESELRGDKDVDALTKSDV